MSPRQILAVDAGSSSVKVTAFEAAGNALSPLVRAEIAGLGSAPQLTVQTPDRGRLARHDFPAGAGTEAMLDALLREVDQRLDGPPAAVGHRVVHGGTLFVKPVVIDDGVVAAIESLTVLAPLHQPLALRPIRLLRARYPDAVAVACFDTAFHATHSETERRYALPRSYEIEGIRRYGFHGLSYESIARSLRRIDPAAARGRVVAAHLGNGASLCAMVDGKSVATSMGFSTLEGLVMGTRCGRLDPGVLLYLINKHGMTAGALEELLYRHCGLLGVSGISGDMRELRASPLRAAREAVDLFVRAVVREFGSMVALAGGLDAVVFTGGIGEHDAATRAEVLDALTWLGIAYDSAANARGDAAIGGSALPVYVLATDETRVVAEHASVFLR